jgi:hypothetical protein
MTDGSNKEDLLNNKDVFKYFENFINYFSSINKEIFLWRYQINQKTSKFIYSSNLPLILKIDDTNIDDLKKGLATFIFEEDIIDINLILNHFLLIPIIKFSIMNTE